MDKKAMNSVRLGRIKDVLKEIKERGTMGCVLEFGVYEGYSLSEIVKFMRTNDMKNKIFGFDSFQGLPRKESNYRDGKETGSLWVKGLYSSSLENTKTELQNVLENIDDITLVEGIWEDVLDEKLRHKLGIYSADLIHIDCDLFSSCNTVLNFCKDIIKPGTFLIFDEWYLGEDYSWKLFAEGKIKSVREIPYWGLEKPLNERPYFGSIEGEENYIIEVLEMA